MAESGWADSKTLSLIRRKTNKGRISVYECAQVAYTLRFATRVCQHSHINGKAGTAVALGLQRKVRQPSELLVVVVCTLSLDYF